MLKAVRSRMTYANVMATVAVFLALGGGAYALSGVPDGSGVYHGCADPRTGALRVVAKASSCRNARTVKHGKRRVRIPGELAITWNQHGAQGLQGVQGSQGPQGAQGAPGSPASLPASEGWHLVGAAGEPGFANGWANNGSDEHVGFYKDPLGIVHLRGSAVPGTGTNIFTLPAGYAPDHAIFVPSVSCGSTHAADIGTDGEVFAGSIPGSCDLDGIAFRAG